MKPRWAKLPDRYLLDTEGRAFEVLDVNTRERELLQLPDPPVSGSKPGPRRATTRRHRRRA